jgi:Mrp family chromosome partitioning ATPase
VTDRRHQISPSSDESYPAEVPALRLTHADAESARDGTGATASLRLAEISPHLLNSLRTLVDRYELQIGELPSPLAVTSPSPDADTTAVSQGLARILAHEHGSYVLWMGSDWLTGDDDHTAGRADEPSLLDVLANKASISSILVPDAQHQRLTHLVTGPIPAGRGHMIARSPAFEQLLSLLEEEFDHVIIDCPPLLGVGHGLALLSRAEGYLLVVRHRSVSIGQVREATELAAPTQNVGVVVTDYGTRVPKIVQRLLGD